MPHPLEEMVNVLDFSGPFAYGDEQNINTVAEEWLSAGFNPETAYNWITYARCYEPSVAVAFRQADVQPNEAAETIEWEKSAETLAFLVCARKMTLKEALTRLQHR